MTDHVCMRCSAALHGDEIALFRKMVCREATQFLCLDCLAADIPTTREKLEALIQWFYRTGVCTLFVRSEDGKEDTGDGKEPGSSDF